VAGRLSARNERRNSIELPDSSDRADRMVVRAAHCAVLCAGCSVSRCRSPGLVRGRSLPSRLVAQCDFWAAILLDVYALGLGVELIARGLRANSTARTNFGLLVISALGIARFFDSDLSFVTRAIGFIVIGVGFLLTNVVLFKKRSAT
jgi:hypothetical protein